MKVRIQEQNETLLMQENLQRLMRNENYFSSLFDKNQEQEQPVNPFRKRMFDKNLRRSTVSCGHYNSTSNHNQSKNDESIHVNSSRISMKAIVEANSTKNITTKQNNTQSPLLMIERTQKMTLAQSRQNLDPNKQRITQIINNFRQELDYLEEKLHSKIDVIEEKFNEQNSGCQLQEKQDEINFMVESLQKIVGFMIENCVNLEDAVMYGSQSVENAQKQVNNNMIYQPQPSMIKREIYPINDQNQDQNDDKQQEQIQQEGRQNISFGQIQNYCQNQQKNHTFVKSGKKTKRNYDLKCKNKGKENTNEQINRTNLPNTFFINDKLHMSNQKLNNNLNSKKGHQDSQSQPIRSNHQFTKPNHSRHISQINNQKDIQFHSKKQNIPQSSYQYSSCPMQMKHTQQPTKSIYETVLEQRQMRIKMKKKLI